MHWKTGRLLTQRVTCPKTTGSWIDHRSAAQVGLFKVFFIFSVNQQLNKVSTQFEGCMQPITLTLKIISDAPIAKGVEYNLEAQRFGRSGFDIPLGRTTDLVLKLTFQEDDPDLNFSRYKFRVKGGKTPPGWITVSRNETINLVV